MTRNNKFITNIYILLYINCDIQTCGEKTGVRIFHYKLPPLPSCCIGKKNIKTFATSYMMDLPLGGKKPAVALRSSRK